jgi:hypothetical protein
MSFSELKPQNNVVWLVSNLFHPFGYSLYLCDFLDA